MTSNVDQPPTFVDVLGARKRIGPYLCPTPLFEYLGLNARTGLHLWVKHENHQPVGAFKVRGGINLISQLGESERSTGVIAASTGNHGQSVAYAARLFGVTARICVPTNANPVKVESMRSLGADVINHGVDFDAAREYCEHLAISQGYRYIHSGNEPLLIAGVATAFVEVLEDEPSIDVLIVPIGGGSSAAGACLVASALKPELEVIGVQSEAAPAAYLSWKAGTPQTAGMGTFAEGLATRSAFELPQRMLRERLDEFVLVSDEEIRQAMLLLVEYTRNLIEGAGAAALAAAIKFREKLAEKRVAVMCSGGNVSLPQLRDLLSAASH